MPPFEEAFGGREDASACVSFSWSVFGREELTLTPYTCPFECPPAPEPRQPFCHEANVIRLSSTGSALRTRSTEAFTANPISDPTGLFPAGQLVFSLGASGSLPFDVR